MEKKDTSIPLDSTLVTYASNASTPSKKLASSDLKRPIRFIEAVSLLAKRSSESLERETIADFIERRENMRLQHTSLVSTQLKRSSFHSIGSNSLHIKKLRKNKNYAARTSNETNDSSVAISSTITPSSSSTTTNVGDSFAVGLLKSIAHQRNPEGVSYSHCDSHTTMANTTVACSTITDISSCNSVLPDSGNFSQSQFSERSGPSSRPTSSNQTSHINSTHANDKNVVIVLDSESDEDSFNTSAEINQSFISTPPENDSQDVTIVEDVINIEDESPSSVHPVEFDYTSIQIEIDPVITMNASPSELYYLLPYGKNSSDVTTYLFQTLPSSAAFLSYLESDEVFINKRREATSDKIVYHPQVIINSSGCLSIKVDGMELTFEGLTIPQPRISGRIIKRFSYVPKLPASDKSKGQNSVNKISFQEEEFSRRPLPLPHISIDNFSLLCLNPGAYVNDVVIDFYLTYLHYEVMSTKQRQSSHIFGCFFYNKLLDPKLDKEQRHAAVSSWTRRINIFEKDFLFIPVLQSSHWFLCIICFPWLAGTVDYIRRLTQTGGPGNKDVSLNLDTPKISQSFKEFRQARVKELNDEGFSPMPCILIFDSLTGQKHRALNVAVLRDFLQIEWDKKYATSHGPIEFTKDTIRGYIARVYTQKNGCDCGVYCLSYAEHFIRVPVKVFSKHHFENTHICPKEDELDGAKIRANIQDLIVSKYNS